MEGLIDFTHLEPGDLFRNPGAREWFLLTRKVSMPGAPAFFGMRLLGLCTSEANLCFFGVKEFVRR